MDLSPTVIVLFFLSLCMCVNASKILPCHGDSRTLQDSERVTLSSCDKPPCKLKRKTTVTVEMKFAPEHDVSSVTNSVQAHILGIPFPFIGVDGASICGKIFDATTGAKAECPLKKGQEYVYKDEFKVLEIYPKIKVQVHWAIRDEHNSEIMCFEVPAKITA